MPLARFEKLAPAKQEAVLQAAAREFADKAFAEASYNRIIQSAGVSKGAMYYYFEDKADLCATVVRRGIDELVDFVGDLPDSGTPEEFWSALEQLGLGALEFFFREPRLAALARGLYSGALRSGESDPLGELIARGNAWVTQVLARGQEVGAVRTDVPLDLLAGAVTGMLVGTDRWFVERWESLSPGQVRRLGPGVLDLCRSLAAPAKEGVDA